MTNTRVKIIIVVAVTDNIIKDADIKAVSTIEYLCSCRFFADLILFYKGVYKSSLSLCRACL
jgi:hypothetical protein